MNRRNLVLCAVLSAMLCLFAPAQTKPKRRAGGNAKTVAVTLVRWPYT